MPSRFTHRIVSAAIRNKDGSIILGVRHFDNLMHDQIQSLPEEKIKLWYEEDVDQGFIDNRREFLTREQALAVAIAAGQILEKTGPKDELFSEDLY